MFPIRRAWWRIGCTPGTPWDRGCPALGVLGSDRGLWIMVTTHAGPRDGQVQPNWGIGKPGVEGLCKGSTIRIPRGFDDVLDEYVTNFYYWEHQETDDNVIEVLDSSGDRRLLRLTGTTADVGHYDGSKPDNNILVEAWFDRVPMSDELLDAIIDEEIAKKPGATAKQTGQIMKVVMARVEGRAEGAIAAAKVKAALS